MNNKALIKISLAVASALCLFGVVMLLSLRSTMLQNEREALQELSQRVEHDLVYANGRWNTAKYNADPNTPHPEGSSGFGSSLYVITTDGFVIERTQPINGLLDSADYKHLLNFQTPQTLNITTNEQWRVLSRPLTNAQGATVAVVMVAYLNPPPQLLPVIDEKLVKNSNYILNAAKVTDDTVDTNSVDIRDVDYDVSFEIVNRFNRVLLNTGRVPTYIDPSYVAEELSKPEGVITLNDTRSHTNYLVVKKHLRDAANQPIGIIVTGKSIAYVDSMLNALLLPALISILIGTLGVAAAGYYFLRKEQTSPKEAPNERKEPETIGFDAQNSVISIDSREISIPYATNQYELAKAIFANPAKRWELDELLEKFGETENFGNWRKVYDATLALNKRTGVKLVVYKDKTFRLNPDLVPHLKK